MLFTTPEFIVFFVIVLIAVALARKKLWQELVLLIASYYFYWYSGSSYILLLILVTLVSYFAGARIFHSKTEKQRKIWLAIGTLIPVGILAYFKYIDFGISSVTAFLQTAGISVSIPILKILLPVGISFYTLQALSYDLDIYFGRFEPEKAFHRYALFLAFFPYRLAGPITRAGEFLPQLNKKIVFTSENIQAGATLILWGLFKKMVIADNLGRYVDIVFSTPSGFSSTVLLIATILFGLQLYYDFSGYAHIAIGCARILGFKLPENFDLPYLAQNIQVFWRKWHMTLSRFIRDYVYIPLGGNRKGHSRTYLNLFVSMVICGFWHGAAWTFVIWGAYHGILLSLHRFFIGERKIGAASGFLLSNLGLFTRVLITQVLVFFGWMIFRANSLGDLVVLMHKLIFFELPQPGFESYVILGLVLAVIMISILMLNKRIAGFIKKWITYDYLGLLSDMKLQFWLIYIIIMTAGIFLLSSPETPEFIYFAF